MANLSGVEFKTQLQVVDLEKCPLCGGAFKAVQQTSKQHVGTFKIAECLNCTHRFLPHPPADHELPKLYDNIYSDDKRRNRQQGRPGARDIALSRTIVSRLPKNARVLDVGANFGSTLLSLPKSYQLEGIELSRSASEAAGKNTRLTIHNCSIDDFDGDKLYDAVFALAVIEHVPSPLNLLSKINRMLKPGGLLVLMTGDYQSWYAQNQADKWNLYHCDGHLHFFSALSLELTLRKNGFTPYSRLWTGPNPFTSQLPSWIGRALHCQTTSMIFPRLFAQQPFGDNLYFWCTKTE